MNSVFQYLCVYKDREWKKERKRERLIWPKFRSYKEVQKAWAFPHRMPCAEQAFNKHLLS